MQSRLTRVAITITHFGRSVIAIRLNHLALQSKGHFRDVIVYEILENKVCRCSAESQCSRIRAKY